MLSTLIVPTSGEIWYDNLSTTKNALEIKKKIGFLTNEIRLDGQFTPNELASYYGKLYGLSKQEIETNKKELFDYFGITQIANRKYETFSTGMKQKTSIAICLIHNPQIIIFDEPTNGLDVLTQRLIEEYIVKLRNDGKCVIISTHLLDVVERLADNIGVIIDGKSVFYWSCEEMIKQTNTSSLSDAFMILYKENHEEVPKIIENKKNNFLKR